MTTYWVIRDGGIECQVSCSPSFAAPAAPELLGNPPLSGVGANSTRPLRDSIGNRVGRKGINLTRRGRVAVALSSLFIAVPLLGAGASAAVNDLGEPPDTFSYTVAAGESLWSIAERFKEPGSDTRDEIYQIKQLNHLASSNLYAGQVLVVVAK